MHDVYTNDRSTDCIQDFHRKYVLVPADNAANNVVVVWRLHFINTLKLELSGTKAHKETSEEEKSIVNGHCNHLALNFSVSVKERQDRFPTVYWLPKLPSLIARWWVGRLTQWWPRHKAIYFSWLGPERFCLLLGPLGSLSGFFCSGVPMVLFDTPGISRCRSQHVVSVESSSLFHHSIYLWFFSRDDPLMS